MSIETSEARYSLALQTVPCPLCGSREYSVLTPARYPSNWTIADIKRSFRASSDAPLLDQLVECRHCELVYVNPRIDEGILLEGYEDAEDHKFIAQNPERIRTFGRLLQSIAPQFGSGSVRGKRILDVGCAGGAFLVAARDFGFDPVGIEPNRFLGETGRRNYGLDIRQGILLPDAFPPASFDVVSLWDVIEHVAHPKDLLATIREILKPGGTLLVNYPDWGSFVARLLGKKWPFLLSVHLLYYTRKTMTGQLSRSGFRVADIRPHFQSLKFGYVLERAEPYVGLARPLRKVVDAIGLGKVPFTYNMGQTLVVASKMP